MVLMLCTQILNCYLATSALHELAVPCLEVGGCKSPGCCRPGQPREAAVVANSPGRQADSLIPGTGLTCLRELFI